MKPAWLVYSIIGCMTTLLGCKGVPTAVADVDSGMMPASDADTAADASQPLLPDAAASEADGGVQLACTLEEIQPILECVFENCQEDLGTDSFQNCVALSCGLLLLTLSPKCAQCAFAALADPGSAADACTSGLDTGTPTP